MTRKGVRRITLLFYPLNWQAITIEQFTQIVDSNIRWYNEK